jgi:acyl-CoA synthetase (AMP-forming)/AMP-acid ligase II
MDAPRANPLYSQWLAVAHARGGAIALRELASGREWSFAKLLEWADGAPPSPPVLHSNARGPGLVLDVLRAWRDGAVLLADDGSGMEAPPRSALGPEICHLKITSGSTGLPRCVMFRAEQLAADAAQIMATMGLRAEWPNLGVISMAHSYGFSNLVLPLLLHGVPLWMLDNPLPETLRRVIHTGHPLTLPAVPAMWQAWERVGMDFASIRLAISAGAPLPVALEATVFARSGLKIHNFYGSSECGGIAYDGSAVPREQATLAGTPMAGVCLAIDSPTGCLRITSAAVADGYLHADPATDAAGGPGVQDHRGHRLQVDTAVATQ